MLVKIVVIGETENALFFTDRVPIVCPNVVESHVGFRFSYVSGVQQGKYGQLLVQHLSCKGRLPHLSDRIEAYGAYTDYLHHISPVQAVDAIHPVYSFLLRKQGLVANPVEAIFHEIRTQCTRQLPYPWDSNTRSS